MEILLALPSVYSSIAWTTFWIWFTMGFSNFITGLAVFSLIIFVLYLAYKFVMKAHK